MPLFFGTNLPKPTPGVITLAAGYSYTCALLSSGTIDCWGCNGYGQLGTEDIIDRLSPTESMILGIKAGPDS